MNITQFQEFVSGIIRTCVASNVPTKAITIKIDPETVNTICMNAGIAVSIQLLPEGEKGFRYQGVTFTW